ncbi:hypothetical protein PHYBOEH_006972 [Phytophthora boehmeriae]|uniref:Uncharacterized protein n=1 Tax=Phytophthora boehmeriae TaxID=109152 RepID=A0A8T1W9D9_9STRA|nr:hypothetical protein PHYBOEH_006972 [Phytophthora boehmeriae]
MQRYMLEHNALDPVADPSARSLLQGDVARAVEIGDVIDDARLEEAIVERQRRKSKAKIELVTQREVTAARKRELAIMLEHYAADNQASVAGDGPFEKGGEPIWFARAVQHGLAPLKARMKRVEWKLANLETSAVNRGISERSRHAQVLTQTPLRPFIRVYEQLGPALPDTVHADLGGLNVPVGAEIPSPPFPHTLADVFEMTDEAINQLGMLMHMDFGIVQGDPLVERQNKVRLFYLYGG